MQSKLQNVLGVSLLCLGLTLLFANLPERNVGDQADALHARLDVKAAVGTKDDPWARNHFEWLRLRNPSTGEIPADIRRLELAFAERLPARERGGAGKVDPWTQRGPINVGGRTRGLAIDISDATGNTLVAGGISGGIFRTTNGGTTWTKSTTPAQLHSVTTIVQDTRAGQTATFYAGTGENKGNSAGGTGAFFLGDGIFKSTDSGVTWTQLASTVSGTPANFESFFDVIWELAIDPSNLAQAEVYAATFDQIYRSVDGGTTWGAPVLDNAAAPFSNATDVLVTPTGVVYAALDGEGSGAGVYCSLTGLAASFTNITPAFFPAAGTYNRIELGMNAAETELWAVARTEPAGSGNVGERHMLAKYTVGAAPNQCTAGAWTDFSATGIPDRGVQGTASTGRFSSQSGYDLFVKVHPANANILFLGGVNLWRLDVSGGPAAVGKSRVVTNTRIGGYEVSGTTFGLYPNQHPDQHSLVFDPANANRMWVGSDGGVHRTDNNLAAGDGGVAWTSLNTGYFTTQFYKICFNTDAADPAVMGGTQDNGTWRTTSAAVATPWVTEFGGDGADCGILNNNPAGTGTSRYASSQNGNVYRLVYDAGGTNTGFTNVTPTGAAGMLFINPFRVIEGSHFMFYPAGATIWRNNNLEGIPLGSNATTATNWTNMTGTNTGGAAISALDITDNTLYYGTADGRVFRLSTAKTAAAATVPVDLTPAGGFPGAVGAFVSGISVNPNNQEEVLLTFSNYGVASVFHSTNALTGAPTTWTDVEGNLAGAQGPSVRSGAIQPGAKGGTAKGFFLGTSTGLYSTFSLAGAGTVWTLEGASNIGNVVVDDVRARVVDGLVVAGTHANGVFSASFATVPVELTTFGVVTDKGSAVLRWATASETNNAGFSVEYRLAEAETFGELGFVEGKGTTTEAQQYEYRAEDLSPGTYIFRLKQIDFDGGFEYSHLIEADVEVAGTHFLSAGYPNPFNPSTSFTLSVATEQDVRVAVYNMAGQQVALLHRGRLEADKRHQFSFDARYLASGQYLLRAQGEQFADVRQVTLLK